MFVTSGLRFTIPQFLGVVVTSASLHLASIHSVQPSLQTLSGPPVLHEPDAKSIPAATKNTPVY